MSITLVLDVLLVILLAATLGFGLVLNKRLNDLRRDRSDLEKLAIGFGDATQRAEDSVATLKVSTASLQERLEKARTLADDLQYLIERGTTIADRLETDVRTARQHEGGRGAANGMGAGRVTPFAGARNTTQAPVPRSQAERNLLQALRVKG